MPINLDFVGLNTLVNEPLTSSTNTIGHALGTTSSAYVNTVTIGANHSVSIPHDDYLVALNIHRNGPYGTPIFKQIRAADNPLIRYHNRNNIFSYVTDQGRIRQSLRSNAVVNSFRERRSKLRQTVETPVYVNSPITIVGSVTDIDPRTGKEIKQRVELKASFNNETQYFGGRRTNRELEVDFQIDEGYEQLIDLYLDGGLDSDDSPIDEVELVKYETTIYPRQEMSGRTNRRQNFIYKPWRNKREDRQMGPFPYSGFGWSAPSQSSWPLDIGPDESGIGAAMTRILSLGTTPEQGTESGQWAQYNNTLIDSTVITSGNADYFPGILNFTPSFVGSSSPKSTSNAWDGVVAPRYAHFSPPGAASASFNPHGIEYRGLFAPYTHNAPYQSSGVTRRDPAHNITRQGLLQSGVTFASEYQGGSQKWEAPKFSGRTPFYDSYNEYCELISVLGKDHTVIPEFRISELVEELETKGILAPEKLTNSLFSITGGLENANNSDDPTFFKVYSTSDFLRNFDLIQEDHSGFLDTFKLTLKCNAIKKFLPYEGFYPVERTVELAKKFWENYSRDFIYDAISTVATASGGGIFQAIMNPLFAPGILYNTIKSGIACDYPISTDLKSNSTQLKRVEADSSLYPNYNRNTTFRNRHVTSALRSLGSAIYSPYFATSSAASGSSTREAGQLVRIYADPRRNLAGDDEYEDAAYNYLYGLTNIKFDDRVPFEAILTPSEFLKGKALSVIRSDTGAKYAEAYMTQKENINYVKFASNFLAETTDFFMENKRNTIISSLPQENPNFGNAKAGKKYMMRLKMFRSTSGSKPILTSSIGPFEYPQDAGDVRETFTMYSNPKNFGEYKTIDCPIGLYMTDQQSGDTIYNYYKDEYREAISGSLEFIGHIYNNLYELKQWKSFVKDELSFSQLLRRFHR